MIKLLKYFYSNLLIWGKAFLLLVEINDCNRIFRTNLFENMKQKRLFFTHIIKGKNYTNTLLQLFHLRIKVKQFHKPTAVLKGLRDYSINPLKSLPIPCMSHYVTLLKIKKIYRRNGENSSYFYQFYKNIYKHIFQFGLLFSYIITTDFIQNDWCKF